MARLLFASPYCLLDPASGAALSVLEMLRLYKELGHSCAAATATCFDGEGTDNPIDYFSGFCSEVRALPGYVEARVDGIPIKILRTESLKRRGLSPIDERLSFELIKSEIERFRPEVLVVYGGGSVERTILRYGRSQGLVTVFPLHNAQYFEKATFKDVARIIVPSLFAQELYRGRLGLESQVLYPLIDWSKCLAREHRPEHVTFINPELGKGATIVYRIVEECRRRGLDWSFTIQEGRGTRETLARQGLRFDALGVQFRRRTRDADMRSLYADTAVLLCPSVSTELMPRVVMEGVINGLPILATRVGGIPEGLGDSGFSFDLPDELVRDPAVLPASGEVDGWIDTLARLVGDESEYGQQRSRALVARVRFEREALGEGYVRFIDELL
jgi:glycosyltransferase involved in cell wall biosynthesis